MTRFSYLSPAQIAQATNAINKTIETFMRTQITLSIANGGNTEFFGDTAFSQVSLLALVTEDNSKSDVKRDFPMRGVSFLTIYIGIKDLTDAGLYDMTTKEVLFQTERTKVSYRGANYKVTHLEQTGTLQDDTFLLLLRCENITPIGNE